MDRSATPAIHADDASSDRPITDADIPGMTNGILAIMGLMTDEEKASFLTDLEAAFSKPPDRAALQRQSAAPSSHGS